MPNAYGHRQVSLLADEDVDGIRVPHDAHLAGRLDHGVARVVRGESDLERLDGEPGAGGLEDVLGEDGALGDEHRRSFPRRPLFDVATTGRRQPPAVVTTSSRARRSAAR